MNPHEPQEDAIREGDPPYRFIDNANVDTQTPSNNALWCAGSIALAAIALSAGILIESASKNRLNGFAVPLFTFGLIAISISAVTLGWLGYPTLGAAGGVLVGILVICSFIPCYGEHVGEPAEPTTHRHALWELGHIH